MSDVARWAELTRTELSELLPAAVVAFAIGATEQHGPHLPTGTDALLAETVLTRAAARYPRPPAVAGRTDRRLILAPTLPFGASDHHLPFGGTVSLAPETLLAVLVDVCRSMATVGARRVVIVNGHGGNTGVCKAAAAAAAARNDLAVGYLDYWELLGGDNGRLPAGSVPGHAGVFETSLVSAVRPDLVLDPPTRTSPPVVPEVADIELHDARVWSQRDGYTDSPAEGGADIGVELLDRLADTLAERLSDFAAQC